MKLALGSRMAACVAALALSVGAAACGDGGDAEPNASVPAAESGPATDGAPGDATSRERAEATLARFYTGLGAGDGAAVCAELTESAQAGVGDGAADGGKCAETLDPLLAQISGAGGAALRTFKRVSKLNIGGDTAVATVVFDRGKPVEVPLQHADGDWKVTSLGVVGGG